MALAVLAIFNASTATIPATIVPVVNDVQSMATGGTQDKKCFCEDTSEGVLSWDEWIKENPKTPYINSYGGYLNDFTVAKCGEDDLYGGDRYIQWFANTYSDDEYETRRQDKNHNNQQETSLYYKEAFEKYLIDSCLKTRDAKVEEPKKDAGEAPTSGDAATGAGGETSPSPEGSPWGVATAPMTENADGTFSPAAGASGILPDSASDVTSGSSTNQPGSSTAGTVASGGSGSSSGGGGDTVGAPGPAGSSNIPQGSPPEGIADKWGEIGSYWYIKQGQTIYRSTSNVSDDDRWANVDFIYNIGKKQWEVPSNRTGNTDMSGTPSGGEGGRRGGGSSGGGGAPAGPTPTGGALEAPNTSYVPSKDSASSSILAGGLTPAAVGLGAISGYARGSAIGLAAAGPAGAVVGGIIGAVQGGAKALGGRFSL